MESWSQNESPSSERARVSRKGRCKLIANFSATLVTSHPFHFFFTHSRPQSQHGELWGILVVVPWPLSLSFSLSLSLTHCLSLTHSLSFSLSLSHSLSFSLSLSLSLSLITHNIPSAFALGIKNVPKNPTVEYLVMMVKSWSGVHKLSFSRWHRHFAQRSNFENDLPVLWARLDEGSGQRVSYSSLSLHLSNVRMLIYLHCSLLLG